MAKVTSKLQLTVLKAIADRYVVGPGSEVEWIPLRDTIRLVTLDLDFSNPLLFKPSEYSGIAALRLSH
jgi:hypothetical protein